MEDPGLKEYIETNGNTDTAIGSIYNEYMRKSVDPNTVTQRLFNTWGPDVSKVTGKYAPIFPNYPIGTASDPAKGLLWTIPPEPTQQERAAAAAASSGSSASSPAATTGPTIATTPVYAQDKDRDSYVTVLSGDYGNPSAKSNNQVDNTYTLVFYEDWQQPDNVRNKSASSVDLPFVQRITMQAPNALTRTRSIDGTIYAEHSGFVQRVFTIEGRSGAVWNINDEDSLAIQRFTNLRNFIERYGKTSTVNKNALVRFKDSRLVLQFSFESEAHFCDILNFNYQRSTESSTYSFEYSLTLVTNGFTGRKFKAISAVSSVLGTIDPNKVPLNLPIDTAAVRQQEGELYAAFRVRSLNFRISQLRLVTDFAQRVREEDVQRRSVPSLAGLSCSFLQDMRLAVSALNFTLDISLFSNVFSAKQRSAIKKFLGFNSYALDVAHMFKGAGGSACPLPPWSDLYYSVVRATALGGAVLKLLIDQFSPPRTLPERAALAGTATTTFPAPTSAASYILSEGTSDAYSVAEDVLGDRTQAWRIIRLNSLRDAYHRGDGTPLSPGSSLFVPAPSLPAAKGNDVLGTDLMIVNGDLVLAGSTDIMRVSGYACYTQNLVHRMQTPRGSNKVFPSYGLSASVHSRAGSGVVANVRTDIRDQVMQDHRTSELRNLVLQELGDKVNVSMLVEAITNDVRTFQFNYTLRSEVSA